MCRRALHLRGFLRLPAAGILGGWLTGEDEMKHAARIPLLLAAALAVLAPLALAQTRAFPEKTKLGTLEIVSFPQARLDGREVLLAPGIRILNRDNTLAIPSTVTGAVPVRYQTDMLGQVREAWILTDDELRQAREQARKPFNTTR